MAGQWIVNEHLSSPPLILSVGCLCPALKYRDEERAIYGLHGIRSEMKESERDGGESFGRSQLLVRPIIIILFFIFLHQIPFWQKNIREGGFWMKEIISFPLAVPIIMALLTFSSLLKTRSPPLDHHRHHDHHRNHPPSRLPLPSGTGPALERRGWSSSPLSNRDERCRLGIIFKTGGRGKVMKGDDECEVEMKGCLVKVYLFWSSLLLSFRSPSTFISV